jgi:colanic acid biosynthesis glycosyl transferase WcaI
MTVRDTTMATAGLEEPPVGLTTGLEEIGSVFDVRPPPPLGSRILIYGLNFAPELTGIGRYTGDMAAWLAEQGHEIRVVTSYPYYPAWRLAPGCPTWRWSRETWRGVRLLRCPLWVPRRPTALTRILHLLSFALSSGPAAIGQALRFRPHLILTIEPSILTAPFALAAARLCGADTWLHVQDLELGAAERLGLLSRTRWIARSVAALYRRTLRSFRRVTTLSERMRAKLAELGRPADAIELFPNWIDTATYRPVDATAMRHELGLAPDDVCVLYAGNLGEKQGVESLLDAAALLADDPRIRLVICGAGAARPRIEARFAAHPNVTLLDPLPDDRFVELLSAADIHVLPQRRDITHYVMPSKLLAMMASGRAIVAQADESCAIREMLKGGAVFIEPEDTAELARAVRMLAQDNPGRARLGAVLPRRVHALDRGEVLARAFAHIDLWLHGTAPQGPKSIQLAITHAD